MDELESIASEYHLNADISDMSIEKIAQIYEFNWIKETVLTLKPSSILDLGYGDGIYFNQLTNLAHVTLVEGSTQLSDKARNEIHENNLNASVVNALFEDFNPKQKFDFIIASHVLEHVSDPLYLLLKIKGWLTPQGKLLIIVPNSESVHRRLALILNLQDSLDTLSLRDLKVGHKRVYNLKGITEDLHKTGFTVIEKRGFFLKPFSNSQLLNFDDSVIESLCRISRELNPELCANLGILANTQKE